MGENYKISVITVTFNSVDTLEETIQSVISQEYNGEVEYIIIDGGSTDGTLDIIKKYEADIACWVSESDYGLYHGMNKGIERATGDIVGMINGDDYYFPGAFEKVNEAFLGKSLDEYIFWGDILSEMNVPWAGVSGMSKRGAFAPHPSMFCPKRIYDRIGTYKLNYKILADYDFMYRAVHKYGIKPIYAAEDIAYFRPGGLASQHIFRSLCEEMLVKIEYGQTIPRAFMVFLLKLVKNFRKMI